MAERRRNGKAGMKKLVLLLILCITSISYGTIIYSHLRPDENDHLDLGTSTYKWQDLWLTGNLSDGTKDLTVAEADDAHDHISADGSSHSLLGATAGTVSPSLAVIVDSSNDIDFGAGSITSSADNNAIDLSGAGTTAGLHGVLKLSSKTLGATELASAIGSGFNKNSGAEYFNLIGASATSTLFGGGVDADAYRRFKINAGGKLSWGSGAAATDTTLYRSTVDRLTTDGSFYVLGALLFSERHVIDDTHAEAFLVRKDADAGDVFTVNTTSSIVTVNGSAVIGDDTNDLVVSNKGVVTMAGDAKRDLTLRPDLDYTTVTALGKPSRVTYGAYQGYSLPLYAADEELFFNINVPGRWDGESDIKLDILVCLSQIEDIDDDFKLQLSWANSEIGEPILNTTTDVNEETNLLTGRVAAYDTYQVSLTIDYDADAGNHIIAHDDLTLRIRRLAVDGTEITGEIIVLDYHLHFTVDKMFKEPD